jgi:hypothetical protein
VQSIRSLIAVGSLLVSAGAIVPAQQPTQTPTPRAYTARFARGHRKAAAKALLRGITLSDAERCNLQAVRAKYGPQMKTLQTQLRSHAQNLRAARQRGDTAVVRSIRANVVTQRQQLMQGERSDLRGALSPDNQAKFDANVKRLQTRTARQTIRRQKLTKP